MGTSSEMSGQDSAGTRGVRGGRFCTKQTGDTGGLFFAIFMESAKNIILILFLYKRMSYLQRSIWKKSSQ